MHSTSNGLRSNSVAGPKVAKEAIKEFKKFKKDKARTKDFVASEKNLVISKDNQILLSKLVEISSGKRTCLAAIKVPPPRKSAS